MINAPVSDTLVIGGVNAPRGQRTAIDLPIARLGTGTTLSMPVRVIRGRRPGPVLFVSAALHGDEINGVEVARRLLAMRLLAELRGTLIVVPVVNVFGFVGQSRYLPDRRDLNRSFPGSERGSLASRLAHLFMNEIVANSTHGIDLHTGAVHRTNLPQVRLTEGDAVAHELALAFGAPVVLASKVRDGSLRAAASEVGKSILMYEGGEALRFDEWAIRAGLRGVTAVMRTLGMLPKKKTKRPAKAPMWCLSSRWVRAPVGGVLRACVRLGDLVEPDQLIGTVGDPAGEEFEQVRARDGGVIIGEARLPIVNEGDALFHIARLDPDIDAAERLDSFQAQLGGDSYFDPEAGPQSMGD